MILRYLIIVLLAVPLGVCVAAETFIAHPQAPGATFSEGEVADILLGRKTTWSDGTRIVLICPNAESVAAVDVYKRFIRKSPAQFLAYWKRQVFTGKGSMPQITKSDAEIIAAVAETPGGFGFVAGEATETVKVIAVR